MRVAKKEITNKETVHDILKKCQVGRLATTNGDGSPVIKPLNYVFCDGVIYFHSARQGEKIDDIARDNRVCFEVDIPAGYVKSEESPCTASYRYQSVVVKGRAHIVEGRDERLRALQALMEKYQPEGGYGAFPADKLALTAVIRIDIIEMTGKQDLRDR